MLNLQRAFQSFFFPLKLRDTIFLCGQIGNSRFLVIRPMCFLHLADVESSSSQVCVSSITNIIITTRHSKRCCYCCCCICLTLNAYPSFLLHEINFCCRRLGKLVVLEHDSRLLSNFIFAHAHIFPPLAYPLTVVSTPLFHGHIEGKDLCNMSLEEKHNISIYMIQFCETPSNTNNNCSSKLLGAAEARRAHNPEDARSKRAAARTLCLFFL